MLAVLSGAAAVALLVVGRSGQPTAFPIPLLPSVELEPCVRHAHAYRAQHSHQPPDGDTKPPDSPGGRALLGFPDDRGTNIHAVDAHCRRSNDPRHRDAHI